MASKTITVCDSEVDPDADIKADEHRVFTWDGKKYELDLCHDHDIKFREWLQQGSNWCESARLVPERRPRRQRSEPEPEQPAAPPAPRRRSNGARVENTAIRQWANEHGHSIGERGRIPELVKAEYRTWLESDAGRRWNVAAAGEEDAAETPDDDDEVTPAEPEPPEERPAEPRPAVPLVLAGRSTVGAGHG